jgi:tripartite motif-containing protein 71
MEVQGSAGRILRLGALAGLGAAAAIYLGFASSARAEFEFLTQWGSAVPGEVVLPIDVERDAAGNTYVLDPFARTISKYDAASNFVLRWGSLGDGPGQFEIPTAIGVNEANGNVYVSDIGGRFPDARARIQRFDANGNFLGEFGGFGTAGGQFGFIQGLSVHPTSQDIFVAADRRIQRFSATGQFELMWGKDVQAGNANTGAETCTANCKAGESGTLGGELSSASGVAASQFGIFVIEDGNARVQRFTVDGVFQAAGGRDVDQGGGTGAEVCSVAANCKEGLRGSGNGELDEPSGIDAETDAVLPHNVYIVDQANHRVQVWNIGLAYQSQFGSQGSGDGQFETPDGIAESQGSVVVADQGLSRVQRFTGAGVFQARFGEPAQSTLVIPVAVGAGPGGVYVTDFRHRVLRFDTAGAFQSTWGSEGSGSGQFLNPNGIGTDTNGDVFVADAGNDRIQRFDSAGAALGAWGSSGSGSGQFSGLQDVAVGPGGSVFTIESGNSNRIQKFNRIGTFLGTWGAAGTAPGQFSGDGVATDAQGNVYVADTGNNRIQKFDANGTLLTTWGSEGTGNGEFDQPSDVAVDGIGNVYVADTSNHRVQRFDSNGNFLNKWGANGGDGTFGDGPGEFFGPSSIAVDAARDIYVLDFFNGRVQKFAAAAGPPTLEEPELELGGKKRQRAPRLRVRVDCGGPPCTVDLSGRVVTRLPRRGGEPRSSSERPARAAQRRRFARRLKPVTETLAADESEVVRLKLRKSKASLRRIRGLLADGGRGLAIVRATATNDAGSDKARRRLLLRRPKLGPNRR